MPVLDVKRLIDNRVNAIRSYHNEAGIQRAQLDVSGGIDSAVMAVLLAKALGSENVTYVHSQMSTNPEQTNRAKRLIKAIGGKFCDGDFQEVFHDITIVISAALAEAGYDYKEVKARCDDPTIMGSIRSTLRAPIGRAFNRMTGGGIRHGTGNECEDRYLRFYQKGGDGEVDTNPLAMLSKSEVYQLAWGLAQEDRAMFTQDVMATGSPLYDVLIETIQATPSPDLWGTGDGHSDEAELLSWTGAPFTYGRIDVKTGKVASFGTIERVARFLDEASNVYHTDNDEALFYARDGSLPSGILQDALGHPYFDGLDCDTIMALLLAAKKAERATRHKWNPNCPTLGERSDLVEESILSNSLEL